MTQYAQDYVGGIEYRTASGVTTLEAIYHTEGRIATINSALRYEYALKDHLGNTRIMFCDKNGNGVIGNSSTPESSEITQENHYFPFGLNMEGTWQNTPSVSDSKYQYNGKELNDDFGLGLSDYGARFYDAAIGQWTTFDPLTEKMRRYSPYNYVLDNPMRFVDPDGMQARNNDGSITFQGYAGVDENGNVSGTTQDKKATKAIVKSTININDKDNGDLIASYSIEMSFSFNDEKQRWQNDRIIAKGADNGPFAELSFLENSTDIKQESEELRISLSFQLKATRENTYTVGVGFQPNGSPLSEYIEKPINVGGGQASISVDLYFNPQTLNLFYQGASFNNPHPDMRVMSNQFQMWSNFSAAYLAPTVHTRVIWYKQGYPGVDADTNIIKTQGFIWWEEPSKKKK